MAESILEQIARALRAGNPDLAERRESGTKGIASLEEHIGRLDPNYARSRPNIPVTMSDGSRPAGVSSYDKDRVLGDFMSPSGFMNTPFLVFPESSRRGVTDLSALSGEYYAGRDVNLLELFVGEALALRQKAEAGEASPDELRLLDAYTEFLQSRTGM